MQIVQKQLQKTLTHQHNNYIDVILVIITQLSKFRIFISFNIYNVYACINNVQIKAIIGFKESSNKNTSLSHQYEFFIILKGL